MSEKQMKAEQTSMDLSAVEARNEVVEINVFRPDRMIQEAERLGADAVVCFRYSTSSIMQSAAEIMAYGTAIKFK